jgi:hypothetical protein
MAYGTPARVAEYAGIYSRDGVFYDPSNSPLVRGTNPTLAAVTNYIADISALFDTALENNWFITPVLQADAPEAYRTITSRVIVLAADLCAFANSKGRLFTDRVVEIGPMNVINKEINAWVRDHATGLENQGVPRRDQSGAGAGAYSVPLGRQT